ncbi:MAG: DnaJ domain-containing protein [Myxococcota bacterium]
MVFDEALLLEENDLSPWQRKRILFVEAHLGRWNHYALLGLKRTASPADLKRGYFKASKEFHPDAYFRKQLGSFKIRVDLIFRAMKAAYDVLADEQCRADYDATLDPADLTPEELRELEARAREQRLIEERARQAEAEDADRQEREARNALRLKEKRLKHNPMVDRLKRSRELLELADTAAAAGRIGEAAKHAQLAKNFAPKDESLSKDADAHIGVSKLEKAKALLRRAEALINAPGRSAAQTNEAGALIEQAIELCPEDIACTAIASQFMENLGRIRPAIRFAQRATELQPDKAEPWLRLLDLCEKSESWFMAIRAAERLLELRPANRELLERLRVARKQAR